MKRLLTLGHSYVVGLNRRLADEMARQGVDRWSVTAAAPRTYPGDLGRIDLQRGDGDACPVVPLGPRFDRSPHLMSYRGLRALLSQQWNVVHCWEEPYVMAAAQAARLAPRRAAFVFATFQNLAKTYPPPFNWLESRVLARANGWIAFGHTVHETQLRRPGYGAIPARIIPPGVDTRVFTPDAAARRRVRADRGWDDDAVVIGFAGRFVPEKGLSHLIEVLEGLSMPWRALFVGGGPELARLEAFSARFPGRVSIAQGVQHSEMPAYYNAMDVLCAPSRTTRRWQEQFGRMLIEAMACGVPIVASRSGEIPHVVADAGIVVAEEDRPAWIAALARLLTGAGERRDLADRGLRRARSVYAWPVVARQHLDFFDSLSDGR